MQQILVDATTRLVDQFDDLPPALVTTIVAECFDAYPVTTDKRIAAVFAVDLAVVRLEAHRIHGPDQAR